MRDRLAELKSVSKISLIINTAGFLRLKLLFQMLASGQLNSG